MKLVQYIKSLLEPKYISQYDEELSFSISIGENCEVCFEQLDLFKGGYKGKPTKCEACEKQINRNQQIDKIFMTTQEITWDKYGNPVIVEIDDDNNVIDSDELLDKLK